MKRFILPVLILCFVSVSARAQWIVNDPVNLVQNYMQQLNSYTSMLTQLETLKRQGGQIGEVVSGIREIASQAQRSLDTVRSLQTLDKDNPWGVVGLAQTWGADPQTVGLSSDIAQAYQSTRQNARNGFSMYSLSSYDRALSAMDRKIQDEREKNTRMRAAENAALAQKRAEEALKLLEQTNGKNNQEAHQQATNSLLATIAQNTADEQKLAAERALAEKAKADADASDKRAAFEIQMEQIKFPTF